MMEKSYAYYIHDEITLHGIVQTIKMRYLYFALFIKRVFTCIKGMGYNIGIKHIGIKHIGTKHIGIKHIGIKALIVYQSLSKV